MALLLFDIDGTLLAPRDMGRRAFQKAMNDLYPELPPAPPFPYDGLLDPQIALRTLESMGVPTGGGQVAAVLDTYLDHLAEERPASAQGYLCPGIPEVLREALLRSHTLGVLTGNVRRGALMKLDFFNLGGYFPSGAFGDDAPERWGLVPVALERVRNQAGGRFRKRETWIVGDSPRDLAAARRAGVRCVLVATGGTSRETLAALEPDLLLDDLSDGVPLWSAVGDGA
jgi:phosphoglycolate phosphatase-like HAD superfamily hydrolase